MVTRRAFGTGRRRWPVAATLGIALASGCEIAGTTAPEFERRVVVHAVLNPTVAQQTIIVERTLPSVAPQTDGARAYEPIVNARVVIYGPRQDSAVAVRPAGADPGVYRVQSITVTDGSAGNAAPNVLRLRPGERYRLRVETTLGVTVGETTIPIGGALDGARRTFNLDRDTLRLNLAAVRNAAGFFLRHETSTAAHEHYAASIDAALVLPHMIAEGEPGATVWPFAFAHESIYPGITQRFTVVAVDSNYFRYYVAGFDPFGDDTRGNTLTGGVGLFGAVAPLMSKILDLTADVDTPIEGSWAADFVPVTLPSTISLYSSPYYPADQGGRRLSLTGTGRAAGVTVEAYGYTETVGTTIQFIPIGSSNQPIAASGSMSGTNLVLTDLRSGERVSYRKR
jgi:hypothetical protein